jgi:hypothetical protein
MSESRSSLYLDLHCYIELSRDSRIPVWRPKCWIGGRMSIWKGAAIAKWFEANLARYNAGSYSY